MRWPGHAPFRRRLAVEAAGPASCAVRFLASDAQTRQAGVYITNRPSESAGGTYILFLCPPLGLVRGVKTHDAPEDVCTLLAKRLKVCFDVRKDNVVSRFWAE
jgi:hypothetical protein